MKDEWLPEAGGQDVSQQAVRILKVRGRIEARTLR